MVARMSKIDPIGPGGKPGSLAIGSIGLALALMLAACTGALRAAGPAGSQMHTAQPLQRERMFIIGQDLGSLRGYFASRCCLVPDAVTEYVDLYELRSPQNDYGGLGIDVRGRPVALDRDVGGGAMNAYRSGTEFGVSGLVLGVSITENDHPGALARLIAGDYDAEIRQLEVLIGRHHGTTYLRIGYEFDGAWNKGYENAKQYIAAYRRIVDLVRRQDAEKVQFVWQASASSVDDVIDHGHENIRDWYPGDEYVDWMAFSWFMHPDAKIGVASSYQPATPGQLADELVAFARERHKPVMVAESAPQAYDLKARTRARHASIWDGPSHTDIEQLGDDQIWGSWFQPMFDYISGRSDVIRGLAYINCNWDAQSMWGPPYANGYWGDSRLETNPELARRFSAAVRRWRERP